MAEPENPASPDGDSASDVEVRRAWIDALNKRYGGIGLDPDAPPKTPQRNAMLVSFEKLTAAQVGTAPGVGDELWANIHTHREDLAALQQRCVNELDAYGFYRWYHGSFKVYGLQHTTLQIVEAFERIAPSGHHATRNPEGNAVRGFNSSFLTVIAAGTGLAFEPAHNDTWEQTTGPILTAYAHARFFLDETLRIAARYPTEPPDRTWLSEGWAALLYLYNLR